MHNDENNILKLFGSGFLRRLGKYQNPNLFLEFEIKRKTINFRFVTIFLGCQLVDSKKCCSNIRKFIKS